MGDEPNGANPATFLENKFDTVFASQGGFLEVGVPGPAGFSMIFADADSVIAYLPATGTPGPLTADLVDPVSSVSGAFGGEVVGLALNLAFSDDGLLAHPPAFRSVTSCSRIFRAARRYSTPCRYATCSTWPIWRSAGPLCHFLFRMYSKSSAI
ncbi:MAG TPA: hypothetical protein VMF32_10745 [Xanthobacteraceae bacterium]|nr:hypothetical protein [Xanthobacteraceae bacterium]